MQYKIYQYYVHGIRKWGGKAHKNRIDAQYPVFNHNNLFANNVPFGIFLSLLFVLLAGHYISLSDVERWRIAISIRCILKQNRVVILGLEKT